MKLREEVQAEILSALMERVYPCSGTVPAAGISPIRRERLSPAQFGTEKRRSKGSSEGEIWELGTVIGMDTPYTNALTDSLYLSNLGLPLPKHGETKERGDGGVGRKQQQDTRSQVPREIGFISLQRSISPLSKGERARTGCGWP